jgi:S1-C subfamily serine protease
MPFCLQKDVFGKRSATLAVRDTIRAAGMLHFAYWRSRNKALSEGWRVRLLSELAVDPRMPLAMMSLLLTLVAKSACGFGAELAGYQPTQSPLPLETRSDSSPTITKVSRQVYRIVVQGDDIRRGGTGFLVSGNRVVATNHHVVDKGKTFTLGYVAEHGLIRRVNMRLIAAFPQKDLALLEANDDLPGEALPLAPDYPELASDLYAIGFPAAADLRVDDAGKQPEDQNFFLPSVLKGNVSRIMTGYWLTNQLQHQTPISPGYSGGPLVDNGGNVVGVSTAINKEASGISYGVASPDLARLLVACALPLRSARLAHHITSDAPLISPPPAEDTQKKLSPADAALLRRGYEMMRNGDIAGARITFEYLASKSGAGQAYEGLAKTYDPIMLRQLNVIGVPAEPDKAQELYLKANKANVASSFSGEWAASPCRNSLCAMLESRNGEAPLVVCTNMK